MFMKALIGRKIGMSQVFSPEGDVVSVTLISAEPNYITLRRIKNRDGYAAVQLALPRKKTETDEQKQIQKGKEGLKPGEEKRRYATRQEFALEVDEDKTELGVDQFTVGDVVEVVGVSKGKGYQGVVKRHGFKGGPASHGHKHVLRQAGSIGSAFPQHVMKGKKMAGRMGGERVTVKNLSVVWIDEEKKVLAVKGAVPGRRGSVVQIKTDKE